jgi:hypothetical protein
MLLLALGSMIAFAGVSTAQLCCWSVGSALFCTNIGGDGGGGGGGGSTTAAGIDIGG